MIVIIKPESNTIRKGEKVRIDLTKSFITPTPDLPPLNIYVTPEVGAPTYDIYNADQSLWFLDYAYSTDGTKTIEVEVNLDVPSPPPQVITASVDIEVIADADDILFSTDEKLLALETNIFGYLPDSRSDFNYVHRSVRELILNWLMISGKRKFNQAYFEASDINKVIEVQELARFWAISLIFENVSNKKDDHFKDKMEFYYNKVNEQKSIVLLTLNKSTDPNNPNILPVDNMFLTMQRGSGVRSSG